MSGTHGGLLALLLVGVLALTGCEEDGVNRVNFPDRGPGTTLLYRETQKLQEELAQIVQENDLDLVVDSAIEGSYVRASFDIEEPKRNDTWRRSDGSVEKEQDDETESVLNGFTVWSDLGKDSQFGQNMVTMVYLWADPQLELEEAQSLAQQLLAQLGGTSNYLVEPYGDVIFVLNRTSSDRIRLDVHAQEDLQGFARKSLYQPVDYQEACDPSPYEEHKYWLEGTVLAMEQATYWAQTTRYTVQATDGHLYELRNSYALHPYRLEEGKAYRFYGNLGNNSATDLPYLYIARWEPLDTGS